MILTIDVTEEDIKNGRKNCWGCPIALAANRATKCERGHVQVLSKNICLYREWWYLEEDAIQFIYDFDMGFTVKPFSFSMEIPDKYVGDHLTTGV